MSQQPKSMAAWLAFLGQADIPVLKHTARELERLSADEALLNARSIANVVTDDPLMTVKLLRYMQMHKHRNQKYELVDVKEALLMMGLDAFFREVPATPIAEEMLDGHLDALVQSAAYGSACAAFSALRIRLGAAPARPACGRGARVRAALPCHRNVDVVFQPRADARNPKATGGRYHAAQRGGAETGAGFYRHGIAAPVDDRMAIAGIAA